MSISIKGQWTGRTHSGSYVIANINVSDEIISGKASEYETNKVDNESVSHWVYSSFSGKISGNKFSGEIKVDSVHHSDGVPLTNEELNNFIRKAGIEYPIKVVLDGKIISEDELVLKSTSTFPTISTREESVTLRKPNKKYSSIPEIHMSWDKFKEFALDQKDGLIYRGQANGWPLQTSYHRTGSADLHSYLDNEVVQLEHHVNAVSDHPYNIYDDRSLGSLLNLAQHHGYPTPLLDWTRSPYVAAFFAFENKESLENSEKVSIFLFDNKKWSSFAGNSAPMRSPHIAVSTLELPSFNNPRVIPQQALVMFSNINDIEEIVESVEKVNGNYLKRVTIDVSEADKAMKDLKLMGLTWGSLFPGLDGLCKQLKRFHFDS